MPVAQHFFSPCPRGLEPALVAELASLGAQDIVPAHGGVGFIGPFELCYRINLESRLASRVLWLISAGRYRDEDDLYRSALGLPWARWFSSSRTIKVKVSARQCPLKSLEFVTLRLKDAVCDGFLAMSGRRPSIDTRTPDIQVHAYLDQERFTLYLDTSGEPLFKRGFRHATMEAPLRENLAAGILSLAGWTPQQTLLDPMCGGGTILVEAALMAKGVAPGINRPFAFQHLSQFDSRRWRRICEDSRAQATGEPPSGIYGYDRVHASVLAARANLKAAGVGDTVTVTQADVLDISAPAEQGILIANPPYGVRTGEAESLARFYPRLGDALKQRFAGWRAYLFTADPRLSDLIGLRPSRRVPLYNGALECRLFEFKIVRGGMRRAKLRISSKTE